MNLFVGQQWIRNGEVRTVVSLDAEKKGLRIRRRVTYRIGSAVLSCQRPLFVKWTQRARQVKPEPVVIEKMHRPSHVSPTSNIFASMSR